MSQHAATVNDRDTIAYERIVQRIERAVAALNRALDLLPDGDPAERVTFGHTGGELHPWGDERLHAVFLPGREACRNVREPRQIGGFRTGDVVDAEHTLMMVTGALTLVCWGGQR